MKVTARDIMVKDFDTVQFNAPIEEAVNLIFNGKVRAAGHKTVSVMVTDQLGQVVGVLTMFDILYHLRPPILNYLVDRLDFWDGEVESYVEHFKGLTVEQVMNSPVRYISPDADLMVIIDRMVREKCRRLPVMENARIIGIVYLSEVFYHMCKTWLKTTPDT
jgi:CBS-domain-containing membrane protein